MKYMSIENYKKLSIIINNYIDLIRFNIIINEPIIANIIYFRAVKVIAYYYKSYQISHYARDYFYKRVVNARYVLKK